VVKPIVEGMRHRFSLAAAEVDYHDQWQRAGLAVATVASTAAHVTEVLDSAERWLWAQPGIEVLSTTREWLDHE
jgi:hypothetical protein